MDIPNGSHDSRNGLAKMEDGDTSKNLSASKPDIKPPTRTLNRVPRACNACRKQKMRCEGADNPPCRRCRHAGLECLFEKPSREASLTGEAGLERIRSLEAHVAEIRRSQLNIQHTLAEIATSLRGASVPRSPSVISQPPYMHASPSMQAGSPASSISTVRAPLMVETSNPMHSTHSGGVRSMMTPVSSSQPYHHSPTPSLEMHPSQFTPGHNQYAQGNIPPNFHPPMLPPAYGEPMGPPSGMRHPYADPSHHHGLGNESANTGSKRTLSNSVGTSAESSEVEEDDGELPASGLVAPWEVLRGLADVAAQRAAKENGGISEPPSRARTPDGDPQRRPTKRRKVHHKVVRGPTFPDVVTKGVISESDARDLFKLFYHGCSTFLPIFDPAVDTFDALHQRSPFAVSTICMVAAKVRDGGGKPGDVYLKCLQEVQAMACATLFAPVLRVEAIQAMILVSGWSDSPWLSGGHAVRMALELSLHQAWPKLLRRVEANKATDSPEDRELVVYTRTWFCLYLFEHQMSYGSGRPAVLKDDESIWKCRLLLRHPLSIEDDMRLVSTVELMAIRERVNNSLANNTTGPVDERTFEVLRTADAEFVNWYQTWDQAFSQKYEDAAFYRQSLQIQHIHAELYHNASALRGIDGPEDVQNMPPAQRELAIRSIQIARQGLDITVNSPSYREGMKYAVHYTHVTATFTASFLLRLDRLFPNDCDMQQTRLQIERLSALMSEIPGRRYALTLQLMLKRLTKRQTSTSRSPKMAREQYYSQGSAGPSNLSTSHVVIQGHVPPSPSYESPMSQGGGHPQHPHHTPHQQHPHQHQQLPPPPPPPQQQQQQQYVAGVQQQLQYPPNADYIWQGFETTASEQLPVWLSDQTLGGNSFTQNGMDAFLLPTDYLPPAPQIW